MWVTPERDRSAGMIMIGRAKGRHFLAYNGAESIELDAIPARRPQRARASV